MPVGAFGRLFEAVSCHFQAILIFLKLHCQANGITTICDHCMYINFDVADIRDLTCLLLINFSPKREAKFPPKVKTTVRCQTVVTFQALCTVDVSVLSKTCQCNIPFPKVVPWFVLLDIVEISVAGKDVWWTS